MASESPDATRPMPVGTQPLRQAFSASVIGARVGLVAQRSSVFGQTLGLSGLQRTTMQHASAATTSLVRMPEGVWPRDEADEPHPAFADAGMAAIARMYVRQAPKRSAPRRGLPQVSRRAALTASGSNTGPSSLARRLQPAEMRIRQNDSHGSGTDSTVQRRTTAPSTPAARTSTRPAATSTTRSTGTPTPVTKEVLQSAQAYARADTPDALAAAFAAAMGSVERQAATAEPTFRPPTAAGAATRAARSSMWAAAAGRSGGFDDDGDVPTGTPTDVRVETDETAGAPVGEPSVSAGGAAGAKAVQRTPAARSTSRARLTSNPPAGTTSAASQSATPVRRAPARPATRFSEGTDATPPSGRGGDASVRADAIASSPAGYRGGLPALHSAGRAAPSLLSGSPVYSIADGFTLGDGPMVQTTSVATGALATISAEPLSVAGVTDHAVYRSPMARAVSAGTEATPRAVRRAIRTQDVSSQGVPPRDMQSRDRDVSSPGVQTPRDVRSRDAQPQSVRSRDVQSQGVLPMEVASRGVASLEGQSQVVSRDLAQPRSIASQASSRGVAVHRTLAAAFRRPVGVDVATEVTPSRTTSVIQRHVGVPTASAAMWRSVRASDPAVTSTTGLASTRVPVAGAQSSAGRSAAGPLRHDERYTGTSLPLVARRASSAGLFAAESSFGPSDTSSDLAGSIGYDVARRTAEVPRAASPPSDSAVAAVSGTGSTPARSRRGVMPTPLSTRHSAMVVRRRHAGSIVQTPRVASVLRESSQTSSGPADVQPIPVSEFPAASPDAHPEAVAMQDRFLETLARHGTPRPVALPERFRPLARALSSRPIVIAHDAPARAALRSVNRPAATLGNVVHLQRAPDDSPESMELLAHELVHAASAPTRPRFFAEPGHDHEEHRAHSIGQVARRATAQRIDPASLPLSGGATVLPRVVQRTQAPSATAGFGNVPTPAPISSAPTHVAQRAGAGQASSPSERVQRTPTVVRREPAAGASGAMSELSTSQRLDQLDDLIELIERRVINELDRRGGRVRGNW